MFQSTRSMIFRGALIALGALCGSVRADDDPIFTRAKQAFDSIGKTSGAADGAAEPIPSKASATATAPADVRIDPAPTKAGRKATDSVSVKADPVPQQVVNKTIGPVDEKVETAAAKTCTDTKCAVRVERCASCNACPKKDVEKCACLKTICNWFSFTDCPSHGECCGFTPRAYHPPLYAWFPCPASPVCSDPGICQAQCALPAARKHFDNPLPKPEMPKMAQIAQPGIPLVSGSSTAMFDKTETFTAPANYKSLPLAPEPPTPLTPAGNR
jgi:hypothetical protein